MQQENKATDKNSMFTEKKSIKLNKQSQNAFYVVFFQLQFFYVATVHIIS